MSRVYNFSAGPAAIPDAVLAQIREDIPDWNGTGMSVMEVSHRGKDFVSAAAQAEQDLRTQRRMHRCSSDSWKCVASTTR